MDLQLFRKTAQDNGIPIIKPDAESLLRTVTQIKQPSKILEIGTGTGYSAAVMLSCGKADSKIYSIEIEEQRYFAAKENLKSMGLSQRALLYQGDAAEILPNITGSYDMVFLDGPKGQYIHFLPYIINVLNKNGVLVCDNVLYRGLVDGTVKMRRKSLTMITNLREFLKIITNDTRFATEIFNIGDGMSVSCYKANE